MRVLADDRKGYGAESLSVEVTVEGYELELAGCGACAAESCLNCGSTGIVKLEAAEASAGDLAELLHEFHLYLGGEVVAVHELFCLLRNGFADLRMAVTETGNVNTGREVDVFVSVNILEGVAESGFKAYGEERYLAGIALHVLSRARVILYRLGTGQRRDDLRDAVHIDRSPIFV